MSTSQNARRAGDLGTTGEGCAQGGGSALGLPPSRTLPSATSCHPKVFTFPCTSSTCKRLGSTALQDVLTSGSPGSFCARIPPEGQRSSPAPDVAFGGSEAFPEGLVLLLFGLSHSASRL